jgi:hypothetical protein
MIGFFLLSVVIQFALELIPLAGGLISTVVSIALNAGFVIVALAQLQGRPWTFNDFFNGFQYLGALFINGLMVGFLVILTAIPAIVAGFVAAGAQEDDPARILGIVVAVLASLPVIYVAIRIGSFGSWLIIDRGCDGAEALQGSWILTRGHFWELLGVAVVLGLINLGGLLLLFVGFLFTYPLTVLA